VAEGVKTTLGAQALAARHGVERPITEGVAQLLAGTLKPEQTVEHIMSRQLRNENE
jgi:glycerol-3-phosphate dehydrogenase